MNYDRPELQQRLASEYVLGTLHGAARRRFQRLLARDAGLRDAVVFWERELVPMAAPLSTAAPPARVWDGIAARVAPATRHTPKRRWWRRLLDVFALAPLAAGLALGIGVTLLAPALRDRANPAVTANQLPESYAGFLQDSGGNLALLVSSLRHGRVVDVKVLRPLATDPNRVLQLWGLPQGKPPIPLGIVPPRGKGTLTLPATSEELLATVAELAVSAEPKSGALAAQPSGPFVLRGPCGKFW